MKTRNKYLYSSILCIFMIILTNCHLESRRNGFVLQRFKIVNGQLESIIKQTKDSLCVSKEENIIVLVLSVHDSIPEFCFTSASEKDISEKYIYLDNRRIIGYIDNIGKPIIVLSTESNKYVFESTFYEFLIPTDGKKDFWYIKFPDNQYHVDSLGRGYPPYTFNPHYCCYAFNGKEIRRTF